MHNTGELYDKIANWWDEFHIDSDYGMKQLELALQFVKHTNSALDIGCGSGGRMIDRLIQYGFEVTGIDASSKMIELAQKKHPEPKFLNENIITWQTDKKFDFIVAWDSLFHLPLNEQKNVLTKICSILHPEGILIYTLGDAVGEHYSDWHDEKFYYSSIGINENLKILAESNCECKHLELDQFPEKHVFIVAQKLVD
ncbi:class I SAM-dependent DNA methyltransferase [Moheibacter sediminis]|uniref:Methyltransferase domain-containing protein n=1 Tax=Moheibacter sediminis TaxID=1434700 RepID=A0A1W1Z5Y9_9FLAO|nr:class I SAM-dependent methyltransferase [Moheibacter sediminis]SMC43869.1 Methyltransferase domain-containing protein [Moheibacter sediminis]